MSLDVRLGDERAVPSGRPFERADHEEARYEAATEARLLDRSAHFDDRYWNEPWR